MAASNVMLHLDDELAGLLEAADMPADQAGAHSTKPEPASPGTGECIVSAAALSCCAVLCCAVLCRAVMCCAVGLQCMVVW